MIEVKVKFYSNIKSVVGLKEKVLNLKNNSKLKDLIDLIISRTSEKSKDALISQNGDYKFIILQNGKRVSDLEKIKFYNDNEILFLPPIAGG